jgi:hypothetical protein
VDVAGQAALGVAAVLVIVYAVAHTRRVRRERAEVLASLIGKPITVGLAVGRGAIDFDAVVEAVDGERSVQFASLTNRWDPARSDYWAHAHGVHDDGWAWQTFVQWVEAGDGTRWSW